MPLIANGLYVVQGEVAILLAAMRRGSRWSSHSLQEYNQDVLVQSFNDLKEALGQLEDLKDLDASHYFGPFLEVIRAGGTTGPVTSIALSAVHKFLTYGLIDPSSATIAITLENIADAVTHTKFVSTDQNSDGVVLLKILHVLHAVVLSPLGSLLTHESMCEIMLSCFRICFEHRLTEHIRKSAEFCLKDIVQHLFTRLPDLTEDESLSSHVRKIRMNKGSMKTSKAKKKSLSVEDRKVSETEAPTAASEEISANNIVDMQGEIHKNLTNETEIAEEADKIAAEDSHTKVDSLIDGNIDGSSNADATETAPTEYVNVQGVRFTCTLPSPHAQTEADPSPRLTPYGLSWIRELFRFLISLCNPQDKMNSDMMIHVGLTLVQVVLEVGSDAIGRHSSLLSLVKDGLCRNLFSLLQTDRLSIFALDIQVCLLMFEGLRTHLKFQLENYLNRLTDMIVTDSVKVSFEQKEISLEGIVQLWRIPGLVTELYLNYDCDLYCSNLFEDTIKLLSKNAFPVTEIYSTHLLSLDALLAIIDTVEKHCHNRILNERQSLDASKSLMGGDRHPISRNIPSHEELMAIKRKKKLLTSGTEQFNANPKKGIKFMQEHHLLRAPLDPQEVVYFLRENPRLDKKMIGEYISNRSHFEVLSAFVKSFDFGDLRIDEALRLYLETFRLPGESPLIAMIMECFADHWHKSNNEPFENADAAFTLAYAIIMLNVDQHNHNVRKQNVPMTPEGFKKNLKAVNGGKDFDQDMLDEIYNAIKNEEIVMPAEQTGMVKENYMWKVLLRRGSSKDGKYIHAQEGLYDHDLFSLIWGPTNSALSFVFEKTPDPGIYRKAISGFRKCAMIAAHYGMSNDFDNLIASLSKFTTLTTSKETADQLQIAFGMNPKAQLGAQTLFHLVHRHGDILREGWTTLMQLILVLYRCHLLPTCLVEADDFLEAGGKIQLVREELPVQKPEAGLFSSLYSYIALGEGGRTHGPEEQEAMKTARDCIQDCRVESVVSESKFLRVDALIELVKAIIAACPEPSSSARSNTDTAVFLLEMIIKVVLPNRDRAESIWTLVRDHLYSVMMGGSACENHYLTERAIVGLLRLAIHLMKREDLSGMVLQSLRMLLLLKPSTLQRTSRQISYGLNELIKTSAANIHTTTDWTIIFTLLECVGAGSPPPRLLGDTSDQGSLVPWAFSPPKPCSPPRKEIISETKSDGELNSGTEDSGLGAERGYTSEPELSKSDSSRPTSGGWILVGRAGELQPLQPRSQSNFDLDTQLQPHDPFALVKCCETLAFLVRDVAHITPFNYRVAVQCIRIFVEACLNGANKKGSKVSGSKDAKGRKKTQKRKEGRSAPSSPTVAYDADESDPEEAPKGYHQITIQLLDLMHTLHTRTAQIHRWWAEEGEARPEAGSLWQHGWCPLLQAIARLCCDTRKQVRMTAITYLQRALLVHDLQTLTAEEWESCFNNVLFPLLSKLLELEVADEAHLEETRVRAATVLSKVFLHHLTPLLTLPSFTTLWIHILDLMDTYMHVEKSDLLLEAIPESLKNMLLVMDSAQVFTCGESHSPLWQTTWDRISSFLPGLQEEFFKAQSSVPKPEELLKSPSELSNPEYVPHKSSDDDILEVATVTDSAPKNKPSSIILQPPSFNHTYTTPIFNHAGQQMTTTVLAANPVPMVITPDVPNYPLPISGVPQSTQPGSIVESNGVQPLYGNPSAQPNLETSLYLPVNNTSNSEHVSQHPLPLSPDDNSISSEASLTQATHTHQSISHVNHETPPIHPTPVKSISNRQSPPSPSSPAHTTLPPAPSSLTIGSYPSAFVPYVSSIPSDSSLSPKHSTNINLSIPTDSHLREIAKDSVLDLGFLPFHSIDESANGNVGKGKANLEGLDNEQVTQLSSRSEISRLDNIPLYTPASNNITAPVQMFSAGHIVSSLRPSNNNDETMTAASALSQYFKASLQNQQNEVFDLLASTNIAGTSPPH